MRDNICLCPSFLQINKENMEKALSPEILSSDLALYLVHKGVSARGGAGAGIPLAAESCSVRGWDEAPLGDEQPAAMKAENILYMHVKQCCPGGFHTNLHPNYLIRIHS